MNQRQRLKCIEQMKKTWKGVGKTLNGDPDTSSKENSVTGINIAYQSGGGNAEKYLSSEGTEGFDAEKVKTVSLATPRTLRNEDEKQP